MSDVVQCIQTPFSPEQVEQLNRFQTLGVMHPFTCGLRGEHPDNEGILVATTQGWHCPAPGCTYTQHWAYTGMIDKDFMERQEHFIANMQKRAER